MKALCKYIDKMSDRRAAYCMLILDLMEMGYSKKLADEMVKKSGSLDYAEDYPELFWHADGWAEDIAKGIIGYKRHPLNPVFSAQ